MMMMMKMMIIYNKHTKKNNNNNNNNINEIYMKYQISLSKLIFFFIVYLFESK
jgi:hypothetical protein